VAKAAATMERSAGPAESTTTKRAAPAHAKAARFPVHARRRRRDTVKYGGPMHATWHFASRRRHSVHRARYGRGLGSYRLYAVINAIVNHSRFHAADGRIR